VLGQQAPRVGLCDARVTLVVEDDLTIDSRRAASDESGARASAGENDGDV
jgi:hypothetical protein